MEDTIYRIFICLLNDTCFCHFIFTSLFTLTVSTACESNNNSFIFTLNVIYSIFTVIIKSTAKYNNFRPAKNSNYSQLHAGGMFQMEISVINCFLSFLIWTIVGALVGNHECYDNKLDL